MDLSNLRTSLREVGEGLDESSSRRRATHLRIAEEDLNAHFRSSALQLTNLYRQAVNTSKASYEKGYTHALAHVLDLWDADRDWLKGYLQRRIEALEAEHEDDTEEVEAQQTAEQEADESIQRQEEQMQRSTPSNKKASRSPQHSTPTIKDSTSHRSSNKRNRSSSNQSGLPQQQQHLSTADLERKINRVPHAHHPQASSSSFYSTPATSANSSMVQPSGLPFSSSFDFSLPLSHSARFGSLASNTNASKSAGKSTSKHTKPEPPIIKISTPASQRRRLKKLTGLRSGRSERVIEIDHPSRANDMVDVGEDLVVGEEDPDAWTDDEEEGDYVTAEEKRPRKSVWTERGSQASDSITNHEYNAAPEDTKILERLDRRKRRRSHFPHEIDEEELSDSL